MKKWIKKASIFMAVALMALSVGACNTNSSSSSLEKPLPPKPIVLGNVTQAKNVILFIGDGMGPNQIKAGSLFYDRQELYLANFPYQTMVETNNALGELTDSAAAATALATGTRTLNKYVGLTTQLEELKALKMLDNILFQLKNQLKELEMEKIQN